jgi:hypothetical protein
MMTSHMQPCWPFMVQRSSSKNYVHDCTVGVYAMVLQEIVHSPTKADPNQTSLTH